MSEILNDLEFSRLEEIYKLFGSIPRLKILLELSKKECTVTDLSNVSQLTQSATSHQLKQLKSFRIIKSRKDGINVFYSLDDTHITKMLETGIEHIKGENCHE